MKHGHLNEAHARHTYAKYLQDKHHKNAIVTRTGFHIDHVHNWIRASPDGLANDTAMAS